VIIIIACVFVGVSWLYVGIALRERDHPWHSVISGFRHAAVVGVLIALLYLGSGTGAWFSFQRGLAAAELVLLGVGIAAWQHRARFPDPDYDSGSGRAARAKAAAREMATDVVGHD